MIFVFVPVALIMGAIGRRIAGGILNQWAGLAGGNTSRVMGDNPARLIFSVLVALSGLLGGAPWLLALLLVPAVFVGTTTGNFNSMAMGRGSYSFAHDFWGMSAHAALSAITPTLLVVAFGLQFYDTPFSWWAVGGFTLIASPLYCIGWIISGKTGNLSLPIGFRGGSELGEAFWGASCALGAFLTFALI